MKHACSPSKSREQDTKQRRADPPEGQRALVYDRVQVLAPLRVGVATLRGARRGAAFTDAALARNQVRANLGVYGRGEFFTPRMRAFRIVD